MNPSACIFGSTDTVLPDGIKLKNDTSRTDDSSSSEDNTPRKSGGKLSFGCLSSSKFYSPNDKVEPLSNDAILSSLEKVVPECLDSVIVSRPPSSSEGAFSQKQIGKSMREFNHKKTAALQQLHDLTTKAHEHNRVPLVQTGKWDIIHALSVALIESCNNAANPNGYDESNNNNRHHNLTLNEDRRLICWTLNNLSIPYENKATMALGENSTVLLKALMLVVQSNLPESYLCCICIMNLTFLAEAIKPVTLFVTPSLDGGMAPYSSNSRSRSLSASGSGRAADHRPRPQTARSRSMCANGVTVCSEGEGRLSEVFGMVLGNPTSLLRILERMIITNTPFLLSAVKSVQGEAIRWACGFIRNVTCGGDENITADSNSVASGSEGRKGKVSNDFIEEICLLISHTEIPSLIVQFVRDSPNPTVKWTKDSLEDICLGIMCNMARFSSREALMRAGAVDCLERIEGMPGIHGYRARAIRVALGALPKQFG